MTAGAANRPSFPTLGCKKMKKSKTIFGAIAGVAFLFAAAFFLSGCGTTRTYQMAYADAESLLFERLNLDRNKTIETPNRVQAVAKGGKLEKAMSMQRYAVDLQGYTEDESLALTFSHRYNIGASGAEYIHVEINRVAAATRIKVNYIDRWWGMWPPFVFWNPGPFRERRIHREIWGKR